MLADTLRRLIHQGNSSAHQVAVPVKLSPSADEEDSDSLLASDEDCFEESADEEDCFEASADEEELLFLLRLTLFEGDESEDSPLLSLCFRLTLTLAVAADAVSSLDPVKTENTKVSPIRPQV